MPVPRHDLSVMGTTTEVLDALVLEVSRRTREVPHYRDGTKAQVGDTVRGKPYNTPHEVTGVVISITPSSESCNCMVAFAANLATRDHQTQRDEGIVLVGLKTDYGETKAFEKLA